MSALESPAFSGLLPIFAAAEPTFRDVLAGIEELAPDIERIAAGDPTLCGERPARFEQDWFPRLDAVTAYCMVRRSKPRRIIEIGSGHSTRFLAQAIADGRLETDLVCIDPQPRAPIQGLSLRHLARPFDRSDVTAATALGPGDILFIDSSHVAMPGTELETLILDILPRLAPGVLVHFHDIFLPDPYPTSWTNRGYNEQIVVAALMQGGRYATVFREPLRECANGFPRWHAGRETDLGPKCIRGEFVVAKASCQCGMNPIELSHASPAA